MRFNTLAPTRHKTVNRAGGEAFRQSPELAFASLLLTSFVTDQFYRSATGQIAEVGELLDRLTDKRFAARAAIYARREFGMRSVTHVVAAEIAHRVKGERWTAPFFRRVVRRPDDVTETLAYYLSVYGKPVPNAMKRGFGRALAGFDAYQLGKYKAGRAAVSLVDAVNLLHPPHTDALAALVDGTLAAPETWEVRLTQAGEADDPDAAKAKAWRDLIRERRLGYFALLRNLRNITEQAPDVLDDALAMLTDEALVRRSLVLPFRFQTAMESIEQVAHDRTRDVMVALSGAADLALANVPTLDGRTLVVLDGSGSMMGRPIEIASLFAAVLAKANDADVCVFSNDARYVQVNPLDSTLTIARTLRGTLRPAGTNFRAPVLLATREGRAYDRMVFLSDMQGWIGHYAPTREMEQYRTAVGADPHVYSFDLQGYGSTQFPADRLYCIAGFSEKVLDVMQHLERDRNAMVAAIHDVEL